MIELRLAIVDEAVILDALASIKSEVMRRRPWWKRLSWPSAAWTCVAYFTGVFAGWLTAAIWIAR